MARKRLSKAQRSYRVGFKAGYSKAKRNKRRKRNYSHRRKY